jgi:hypothetical protein
MKTAAVESFVPPPQGDRPRRNEVNTRHPKAGERRRVRQPLRLDRLPLALLDRIRAERAHNRTWDEIERDSPLWPEWEQA